MYKVLIKCRQPAKNWLLRVLSRLLFWELQKGAKDKVRNHRLLLHPSHPLDKENSFIISTQLRGNRRWVLPVNMCPFLSVLTFYFYWLLWYLGFYIAESFLEILVGTIKLKLGLHCYTDCERWKIQTNTVPRRHIGRHTSRPWNEDSFVVYTTGYPHNLLVGKWALLRIHLYS